ncbi:MAG: hypothetical protein ACP5OZ_03030 [Candidatus Woesearchaeota archaeon]
MELTLSTIIKFLIALIVLLVLIFIVFPPLKNLLAPLLKMEV